MPIPVFLSKGYVKAKICFKELRKFCLLQRILEIYKQDKIRTKLTQNGFEIYSISKIRNFITFVTYFIFLFIPR